MAQIAAEVGSQRITLQKSHPQIKTTATRPREYYFTESSDEAEIAAVETSSNEPKEFLEKSLYPILIDYLKIGHNLSAKRIDEHRSSNTRGPQGNKWLNPDIVAIENLADERSGDVIKCAKNYGAQAVKLWSFEVKQLVNLSNVRSSFFQTVSNSSWANYGYLVSAELEEHATKELRMLSAIHGIGFILLDKADFSESQVIIPAKDRGSVDWNSIDRLISINRDFNNFINDFSDFCQTGRIKFT